MTQINPADLDGLQVLENRFWRLLEATVTRVFDADHHLVDNYRSSLAYAPAAERILALHDDPLDVAATLVGAQPSPDRVEKYDQLVREESATFDPFSFVVSIVPPETPRRGSLVSEVAVHRLMHELGYRHIATSGELTTYGLDFEASRKWLPDFVVTSAPQFKTSHRQPAYDYNYVLELMSKIFIEVARRNPPRDTADLIKKIIDQFEKGFIR